MNDKVTIDEIVKALHFCRSMGAWAEKSCDLANRIESHGIEQPSIDALIAEIEVSCRAFGDSGYYHKTVEVYALLAILDKYRGQK